jgi:REP element-mobilizing transposase RayT
LSHSYAQNHIHLVFSTKSRQRFINKSIQKRLWAYIAGICKNHQMLAFAVGGTEDHVHVLYRLPPIMTLVESVAVIKANSSKWIRPQLPKFAWQKGYGAFSVSSSKVSEGIRYINDQEAHHRKISFEQEFVTMLRKHGIEYDPEFVFG